ncbi:hypothetical protein MUGA111182_03125 [Mucilaginibacter galii]|uniref:DUF3108 domain-containing protein n=1 Tax=Mucilaginibacter galii TaxID=2005073 RepID=A0A917J916_9SPHI|nr:hypothetical protein [Mucilaginibacter galii]GGI50382.1 hypothetical protein GCM10011425_15940 [Mucilaginibacter galii]
MLKTYSLLTFLFLSAGALEARSQSVPDTIIPSNHKLNVSALKPGLKQYLVYAQSAAKNKVLNLSVWVRDVKAGTHNGEAVITTTQHWYSNDTAAYRSVYSVNRGSDFMPIYHTETIGNHTRAYNWAPTRVTGADTLAANESKTFKLDLQKPCFNWNLDIETFEQLQLASGKSFAINFYDAGHGEPKYTLYKVVGSEVLTMLDNTKIDCWKLETGGKAPNGMDYTQTFWLSKKGHEFVKEEDKFGPNMRVKIKLPLTTPNIVANFNR